jgi:hypothetical protein
MSLLAIIAIVLVALILVFFIGGLIAARRHADATADQLHEHIARADRALEAARAADRGWDVVRLEEAARTALQREAAEFRYDSLNLVLVDDRPGTAEDRAEFVAARDKDLVRVAVTRRGDNWDAQIIS